MKPTFEEILDRIREHSGETFKQIRGGEFTYEFRGGYLDIDVNILKLANFI